MEGISWFLGLILRQKLAYPYQVVVLLLLILLCNRCIVRARPIQKPSTEYLRSWPVVGMLPSVLANAHKFHDWSTEVLWNSGGTVILKGPWFTGMEAVVTADPANANYTTSTARAGDYPKGPEYRDIFECLGDGILNADHEPWRVQRRWFRKLMRDTRFRRNVELTGSEKVEMGLLPVLDHMAAAEEERPTFDLQDVMQRFTFDATCVLVWGFDPSSLSVSLPTVPFSQALDDAEEILFGRHTVPKRWWKLLWWLRVGNEKTIAEASEMVDRCIAHFIMTRRKEVLHRTAEELEQALDLLTSCVDHNELGEDQEMQEIKMKSDKFFRDMVLNMLVAGRDTTSAALSWFFWEISRNTHAEAKILDELKTKLQQLPAYNEEKLRGFGGHEVGGLVYLHAALCASLRLHPPLRATVDDTFPSGHKIRPGLKVYGSLYMLWREWRASGGMTATSSCRGDG